MAHGPQFDGVSAGVQGFSPPGSTVSGAVDTGQLWLARTKGDVNIADYQFAQYNTDLHPIVIAFMVCMIGLVWSKRSRAVFAVLAVCLFIPMGQRVIVGGIDFTMMRLLMFIAYARVLLKQEYRDFRFGRLDYLVVFWVLSATVFHILREGPSGATYRLGISFDQLSSFFFIRLFVRSPPQVLRLWTNVARLVLVLAVFFAYEAVTLHNVFGYIVEIRNGRPRSQGAFSHPIHAGTFASTVIPMFMAAMFGWRDKRRLFLPACVAATVVVLAAGSSGPVIAWGVGVFGWAIWSLRKHMRKFLGAAVAMAVVLHFIREKPVWHLIARLSSITGGQGYHRYRLMDAFIKRFDEWWLVGTNQTAYWGWGLEDITNQYIGEGVGGGLVTLILFVVVLRSSFFQLRVVRNALETIGGPRNRWALLAWGSSVSLAAHCVSFISVNYYGQMIPLFFILLATIPAMSRFRTRVPTRKRQVQAPRRESWAVRNAERATFRSNLERE